VVVAVPAQPPPLRPLSANGTRGTQRMGCCWPSGPCSLPAARGCPALHALQLPEHLHDLTLHAIRHRALARRGVVCRCFATCRSKGRPRLARSRWPLVWWATLLGTQAPALSPSALAGLTGRLGGGAARTATRVLPCRGLEGEQTRSGRLWLLPLCWPSPGVQFLRGGLAGPLLGGADAGAGPWASGPLAEVAQLQAPAERTQRCGAICFKLKAALCKLIQKGLRKGWIVCRGILGWPAKDSSCCWAGTGPWRLARRMA